MSVSEQAGERTDRDDWDAHWDQYAIAAEYNPAQSYRRRLALRLLERRTTPERLLDIGSGQGDLLVAAAERWPRAALVGLEASQRGNEIAQVKLPRASFVLVDLGQDVAPPPRLAGWATHAVCSEVLEHVDEPVAFLRRARAYLCPGARLIVTVPGGPMSAFDERIGHRRHYTPERLRETFEESGLSTAATFGAGFPFFNLYRRVVIARGEQLASDVSSWDGRPNRAARAAMAVFRPLLVCSLPRSAWGSQIIGVAYEPR
ncbi:MAG TPA: class I SAM-dependent methyltransferase [Solirubrobacteraceae bacterium]|nr:class I SAM-dependent methyltransferase [Solirubrobacteraceae bacterium]